MIEFLSPVSKKVIANREILPPGTLGKQIEAHSKTGELPNLKDVKFAILGIKENRNDVDFIGAGLSFDSYRKALHPFHFPAP